jgi:two-component system, NarL family, response regulator NreC
MLIHPAIPATGTSLSIRVVVVDRLRLLAEALKAVCSPLGPVVVVGTGTRAEQLCGLLETFKPNVLLLDVCFLNERTEQALLAERARCVRLRLVLLDDAVHDAHVWAALRLGASGYWTKQESFTEILARIQRVAASETVFCPAVSGRLTGEGENLRLMPDPEASQFQALTAREFELLPYLAQGLSIKQVASLLNLSPSTVDNHKSRIMKKLNVHKTTELTRLAIREGLIAS